MAKAKIVLHYDVVSPWGRIAYYVLKRYRDAGVWDFQLELRPMYLGGVMVASGNQPPSTVPAKGEYLSNRDTPLCSEFFGLPYKRPVDFPVNTINIIRLLTVIQAEEPQAILESLTELFLEEIWSGKGNPDEAMKPANFHKLVPTSILSADKLKKYIGLSQTPETKEKVKAEATILVKEGGAFGFPWIEVTREDGKQHPFFGADRFEVIAYFLGGGRKWNGPFPDARVSKSHL